MVLIATALDIVYNYIIIIIYYLSIIKAFITQTTPGNEERYKIFDIEKLTDMIKIK